MVRGKRLTLPTLDISSGGGGSGGGGAPRSTRASAAKATRAAELEVTAKASAARAAAAAADGSGGRSRGRDDEDADDGCRGGFEDGRPGKRLKIDHPASSADLVAAAIPAYGQACCLPSLSFSSSSSDSGVVTPPMVASPTYPNGSGLVNSLSSCMDGAPAAGSGADADVEGSSSGGGVASVPGAGASAAAAGGGGLSR